MENIKNLVQDLMKTLEHKENVFAQIEKAWHQAAGLKMLRHSKIVSFKKGRLTVYVDSPNWLFDLNLKKDRLVNDLNSKLSDKKIKTLYLRVGDIN